MALKCGECGRDVPDRVGVCPQCGAPFSTSDAKVYEAIGFLLIMGGVISWTMVPLRFALMPVIVGVGVFLYAYLVPRD
jgi:uncharacterized OB-fold protein